jgi:predicted nucleotidyltransferase
MKEPYVPKEYRSFLIETGAQKVLGTLFEYPEKEFSLSDLASVSGVAKANIGAILENFEKNDLIEITKLANIWRIRAKLSWHFLRRKIVYNLNLIYQSGLIEFLYDYFDHPKAIVLFGSFRKGEDVSSSDIDIAIESDKEEEYRVTGLRELSDLEKHFRKKVQLHIFNKKTVDINVFNSIANGIVLTGFLEVKP